MKVVAKVTVYDRIVEEIAKLLRQNRRAEYVVVTEREYQELRNDDRTDRILDRPMCMYMHSPNHAELTTAPVFTTWTFERTGYAGDSKASFRGRNHIQVVSNETFQGVPLLVVPSDFHPR